MVQRAFLQSAQTHPGPTLASPWGSVSAQQDLGLGPSLTATLVSQLPGLGSSPSKGRNHLINIHCSAVKGPFPRCCLEPTFLITLSFLLNFNDLCSAKIIFLDKCIYFSVFCALQLFPFHSRRPGVFINVSSMWSNWGREHQCLCKASFSLFFHSPSFIPYPASLVIISVFCIINIFF